MSLVHTIGKEAKKDTQFMKEYDPKGDNTIPGFWNSTTEWGIFSAAYCGWLIGKHGPSKAEIIYEAMKRG